jgi:DnaJ-class molecular chaperone
MFITKAEVFCHGCGGRGWVDSEYRGAQICPVCQGHGRLLKTMTMDEMVNNKPIPEK